MLLFRALNLFSDGRGKEGKSLTKRRIYSPREEGAPFLEFLQSYNAGH